MFVLGRGHGGREDDRHVLHARDATHAAQHLVAVDARHHHVQQDEIGTRRLRHELEGTGPGSGGKDPMFALEQLAEHAQVLRVVVDDQDDRALRRSIRRWGLASRLCLRGSQRISVFSAVCVHIKDPDRKV